MPVTIDGTAISEVTIDGDVVQEITMDGDVVYSAGSDLVDDFEHNALTTYYSTVNGSMKIVNDTTLEGNYHLRNDTGGYEYSYARSQPGDGLDNYIHKGNAYAWQHMPDQTSSHASGLYFCMHDTDNTYYCRYEGDDTLDIISNYNGSTQSINETSNVPP